MDYFDITITQKLFKVQNYLSKQFYLFATKVYRYIGF